MNIEACGSGFQKIASQAERIQGNNQIKILFIGFPWSKSIRSDSI